MLKINKKITPYNFTLTKNKKNEWLVLHYVGAVSSAKANANYFYTANRGASAHYFVDEHEIWQVVEDNNTAWHIGGAKKYYNNARNNNSIGIEMCCKKDANGKWYIEPQTIQNTIELARELCKKYNIKNVCRHYDATRQIVS
jgi:N-acetyl-anhydromuramyl-L-alanine amidase AmpD